MDLGIGRGAKSEQSRGWPSREVLENDGMERNGEDRPRKSEREQEFIMLFFFLFLSLSQHPFEEILRQTMRFFGSFNDVVFKVNGREKEEHFV